jgi:hypothetical protein
MIHRLAKRWTIIPIMALVTTLAPWDPSLVWGGETPCARSLSTEEVQTWMRAQMSQSRLFKPPFEKACVSDSLASRLDGRLLFDFLWFAHVLTNQYQLFEMQLSSEYLTFLTFLKHQCLSTHTQSCGVFLKHRTLLYEAHPSPQIRW